MTPPTYPQAAAARAPRVDTTRLRLRPVTQGDLDTLHELWTHPDVRRHLWDDEIISRERACAEIDRGIASLAAHGFGYWLVHDTASGAAVGFYGPRAAGQPGEIELLYAIAPSR